MNRFRCSRRAFLGHSLALSVCAGLGPVHAGQRPSVLRIGLLPGESAPTVIRLNEPLRMHLESRIAIPVELIVGSDYATTGEALRFGRIDIAYLGPVTYVLQSARTPLEPFAKPSRAGSGPTFTAAIIVGADSAISSLADIAGAEVGFGDPASTSGTWVPRHQLLRAGLVAGRDYAAHTLGAHDAVALAVANGRVAAGGISRPILDRLVSEGVIDADAFRVLAESAPIPEYCWTFRAGLSDSLRAEIRGAFVELEDRDVLGVFRADRFVEARDSDYDVMRGWISELRAADEEWRQ